MVDPREGFLFTLLGFAFLLISMNIKYLSDNMGWNMVVCFEDRCGISSPILGVGYFGNESCGTNGAERKATWLHEAI